MIWVIVAILILYFLLLYFESSGCIFNAKLAFDSVHNSEVFGRQEFPNLMRKHQLLAT